MTAPARPVLVALLLVMSLTAASCKSPSRSEEDRGSPADTETPDIPEATRGWLHASCRLPTVQLRRIDRGLYPGRGPHLSFVPHAGNPFGNFEGSTTHSGPWRFLQQVPLVLYGPGFIRDRGPLTLDRETTLADVAPTLATLIGSPFPQTRPGVVLREALVPAAERPGKPRLVMVVVWDGGGRNVLDHHRGRWPFLESLEKRGTSIVNATVGSSPSITPSVHTTLGSGAFPRSHGITNILQREGDAIVPAFGGISPRKLLVETLADIHDRATDNRAKIGMLAKAAMHLGMIGHGAYLTGADHDIAVLLAQGADVHTNESYYSYPSYLESVVRNSFDEVMERIDREDGTRDGKWLAHPLPDDPADEADLGKTPFWTFSQTRLIKALLRRDDFGRDRIPDLFYTNYKDPDFLGHAFNFLSEEVGETISYADQTLEELVGLLNAHVGKRRWVLVVTADHGQSPHPRSSGRWPISTGELRADIGRFVGVDKDELIHHMKQNGIWLDRDAMRSTGVTLKELSRFLVNYTIADNASDQDIPDEFELRLKEPVFDAAFPSSQMRRVLRCASA